MNKAHGLCIVLKQSTGAAIRIELLRLFFCFLLVMVVMMVSGLVLVFHAAIWCMAIFCFCFQFKRCMRNAEFLQFFSDGFFHRNGIRIRYNVHCGIICVSVHTPNVDVVNVQNAGYFREMVFQFIHINAAGYFFEEEPDGFF